MNTKVSRWLVFLLAAVLVFSLTLGVSAKKGKKNKHLGSVNKFTGSFTTKVPIKVPKYRGLAPKIKLTYSSHGSNGWLGVGWNLSAGSYIQRGTENHGAPNYDSSDTFYLGSQKLVEDTSLGGTHATERQNYQRIEWDSSNDKWYIWQKDGTKLTYEAVNTTSAGTFRWGLKKKEDTNGNTVNYYYWTDNGEAYLDRIEYNSVKIKFHSETRSDQPNFATGAGLAKMDYRLKTIDVQVNGNRARAYDLSYTTSDNTNRSVLSSVQQYGTDATIDSGVITGGTSLPQKSFDVTSGGALGSYDFHQSDNVVGWNVNKREPWLTGDMNGDGLADYVTMQYTAANSSWDYGHITIITWFSNGDGSFNKKSDETGWAWADTNEYMTGDFNGDGKTDIVHAYGSSTIDWCMSFSDGDGTFTTKKYETGWAKQDSNRYMTGDYDGDGRAEVIHAYKEPSDSNYSYPHVDLCTTSFNEDGTYSTNKQVTGWAWADTNEYMTGDFNGDGKTDITHIYKNAGASDIINLCVSMSDGDGTFTFYKQQTGWAWVDTNEYMTGDFNGDGKTDIVHAYNSSTIDWCMSFSDGDGTFTTKKYETGWDWKENNKYMTGDFNGDGKTDITHIYKEAPDSDYDHADICNTFFEEDGTYYSKKLETGWHWLPYNKHLACDVDGNGKSDMMRVYKDYHIENTTVDTSGPYYDGLNAIREIKATGTSDLKFRVRGEDGYSDLWLTYTLDQGTALIDNSINSHKFAGGPITFAGTSWETWNLIDEVKTDGNEIKFEVQIGEPGASDWEWKTITLQGGATATGSFSPDPHVLREVIGLGDQIKFMFEDADGNTDVGYIDLQGANVSGHVDLGDPDSNSLAVETKENYISFSDDEDSGAIRFQPDGEKRIRQVLAGSSQESIEFIMEDFDGNNSATYPVELSSVYAMEKTTANSGEADIEITSGDDGLFLTYDDWDSWQGVHFATSKDGYKFVEEDISLDTAITDGDRPDLVNSVSNGFGATTDVTYTPSSNWSDRQLPAGLNFATVDSLTTSDGRGNSGTTDYWYTDARYDFEEQEFRGFGYVYEEIDSEGNYIQTYYKQNDASAGKIDKIYLRDSSDDYYKYMYYTYTETSSAPYESNLTKIDKYQRNLTDSPRHIQTEMIYDSYGNLTKKKEYGDVDVSGDERTTVIDHKPNTTDYIVNLPKYKEIYEGIGTDGTKMKRAQYVYDSNSSYEAEPTKGLLTRKELWDDENNKYVDHEYSYDSYGNLTKHKNPLDNVVKELTYDSTYHVYVVEKTNELGHTKSKSWNYTLGKVTSVTDTNSNEITKSYDVLGRKTKVSYPDGGYEEYDYVDWGTPSSQHVKKTTKDSTSDNLWQKSYFDGLRRTYKLEKDGGRVKKKVYKEATDLVIKESYWYDSGGSPTYIEKTYDGMGRVTKTTYPDGNYTETVYGADGVANKVAEYDELGNKKETWKDAYGNTTKVREHNGDSSYDTLYTYNPVGKLTKLEDAKGNITTLTWDSLGRRQKIDDMDKGVITQDFNDAGQKTSRTDAKGQTITYSYDASGRLTVKEYPDGSQITYNYDETSNCTNGDGRLTSVSYPKGSLTINSYNFEGEVTSKTKTVDGVSKTFDYSYDVAGRVVSITYPDGETVDYNYNEAGKIEDIPGYVDNFDYNAEGKLITAEYANGVTENFTYDGNRQWLDSAAVTNSSGTNLYEASYSRKDNGLITDYNSGTHQSLSFTYDDLNRLTEVSGDQSQTFSYNKIGNMTSNSKLGDYSYGNSNHAHAVTSAGGNSYSYDDNGNMTSAPNKTINWNYEDRVDSIDLDSGDTINFAYDENGKRILKKTPSETIRYFGKALKITNGDPVKFIYAANRLIAKKDSSGNKFWFHKDHLNSIRVITNESEEVVKDYDYRAYGKVERSSGSLSNEFKFGGHIADDSTGLIYMKSRYYEPTLGRFISADTKVPQPGNPQNFNRYSYCQNNPVNKIDPNGKFGFMQDFSIPFAPIAPARTSITVNANTMTGSANIHVPGQQAPLLSIDLRAIPSVSAQQIVRNPNQPIDLGLPNNPVRGRFRVGASIYKGIGGGAYIIHETSKDEYYLFIEGGVGGGGGLEMSYKDAGPIKPEEIARISAETGVSAGIAEASLKAGGNLLNLGDSFQLTPIANVGGIDFTNMGSSSLGINLNDFSDVTIPGGNFSAHKVKLDFKTTAKVGFVIPLSGSWYARNADALNELGTSGTTDSMQERANQNQFINNED